MKPLERDWHERLTCCDFPRHLWRRRRTPHRIERGWVEVRRRTRPRVGFVNLESLDRII